jgi:hypothetical protein
MTTRSLTLQSRANNRLSFSDRISDTMISPRTKNQEPRTKNQINPPDSGESGYEVARLRKPTENNEESV